MGTEKDMDERKEREARDTESERAEEREIER